MNKTHQLTIEKSRPFVFVSVILNDETNMRGQRVDKYNNNSQIKFERCKVHWTEPGGKVQVIKIIINLY